MGRFIVIFSLAAVIFLGIFLYTTEKKAIQQEYFKELQTVADYKANNIVAWYYERVADASVVAKGPLY